MDLPTGYQVSRVCGIMSRGLDLGNRPFDYRRAYTLMEVLVVIGLLVVLSAIVAGVKMGLDSRVALSRARGEMAVLAQSLQQYKLYYGDYPWIDSGSDGGHELYWSLIGNRRPTAGFLLDSASGELRLDSTGDLLADEKGRHFIETAALSVGERQGDGYKLVSPVPELPMSLDGQFAKHVFLDPWRRPYKYGYKTAKAGGDGREWLRAGYLLMSNGPDGEAGVGRDILSIVEISGGIVPVDYFDNEQAMDNLILGEYE